jgi:hypothetical protein
MSSIKISLRLLLTFFFFHTSIFSNCFEKKVNFSFSKEPIDVVIPCCEKDLYSLDLCIKGIRKNGKNIRRIIVVSDKKLTDEAEWFEEKNYPFTKKDLALEIFHNDPKAGIAFLESPHSRIGWIYQQFLKLYAYFVIPDISENVLILDADTIFLNPIEFQNDLGEPFFTTATENVSIYFNHGKRLLPGFKRVYAPYSGIAHHMLFQGCILEDLFDQVTKIHNMDAWKAICHCIDPKEVFFVCLSEYEIYFNFTLLRTDQAKLRSIKWMNVSSKENLETYKLQNYAYVSCQSWMRSRS